LINQSINHSINEYISDNLCPHKIEQNTHRELEVGLQ